MPSLLGRNARALAEDDIWLRVATFCGPWPPCDAWTTTSPADFEDFAACHFDGTTTWLRRKLSAFGAGTFGPPQLFDLLSNQFGFFRGRKAADVLGSPGFEELLANVLPATEVSAQYLSSGLPLETVAAALRNLRSASLAQVAGLEFGRGTLFAATYCGRLQQRPLPVGAPRSFLRERNSAGPGAVQWIHVHEPSICTVLALSQLLTLDPELQSLVRSCGSSRGQVRIENPDGWSGVLLPAVVLDEATRESFAAYRSWVRMVTQDAHGSGKVIGINGALARCPSITVCVKEINVLVLSRNGTTDRGGGEVFTCAAGAKTLSNWAVPDLTEALPDSCQLPFANWWCWRRLRRASPPTLDNGCAPGLITEVFDGMAGECPVDPAKLFPMTTRQCGSGCCAIRRNGSHHLALRLLAEAVGQYGDAMKVYRSAVAQLHECLFSDFAAAKPEAKRLLDQARLDLLKLKRRMDWFIKEGQKLLCEAFPTERANGADNSILDDYKRVVRETLHKCNEGCDELADRCAEIVDADRQRNEDDTDFIVASLTMVMYLFFPITIITGWYGMNWENMPELKLENGYFYFIVGAVLVFTGNVIFLHMLWNQKMGTI